MAENSQKMDQQPSKEIYPGSGDENVMATKEKKICESLSSPQYSMPLSQPSNASTTPTLKHLSQCVYETNKISSYELLSTAKCKCQQNTVEDQIENMNSVLTKSLQTLQNNISNTFNEKVSLSSESCLSCGCNCNGHSAIEDKSVQEKDDMPTYNGLNREDVIYTDSDSDEDYSFDQKEFEVIIYDPSLFMPLPTQIAGHGSEGDGEKGFLKRPDGRLLKPVQAPPRGRRELDFYKKINSSKDPIDVKLRKCIPEFFGVEKVGFRNGITVTEEFLILRDITEGFSRPAIMDIKIGSRTWGPDASTKKQAQEDAKYAGTKHPFGFR